MRIRWFQRNLRICLVCVLTPQHAKPEPTQMGASPLLLSSAFIGGSFTSAVCASIGRAHARSDLTQNQTVTTNERALVRQKQQAKLTFFPNLRLS
ncbi:MAG: hypothetical protein RLZZ399_1231 [Verrucomicrobiota bacterium]|jgi:hypothetical protein